MSNALDWESGIVNRNYFIARELVASKLFERVLFVDFLSINPIGLFFGKRRTALYTCKSLCTNAGGKVHKRYGLRHVVKQRHDGVFVFSGLGLAKSVDVDMKALQRAMTDLDFTKENTLVWSYNAFEPRLLQLPAKQRVFDAVDNWSQHASYQRFSQLLESNYQVIGRDADIIFTVSDGLQTLFPAAKTQWVPNGVDLDAFAKPQPTPQDMAAMKRPRIGYIGTVQERIDFDLLKQTCAALPEASFVFIGPVWGGVQGKVEEIQRHCSNVRFLGRRSYESVPAYIQALDVTLIPHRLDAFIESTNPMKLYDYLAGGKPVVTTPGAGTEAFADVIHIVKTPESFIAAIKDALTENTPSDADKRRAAVSKHTWKARAKNMQDRLKRAIV